MKVYDELRRAEGFETLIALTFNASLSWFERSILAPLQQRGVRRCLVLADAACLSVTLKSEIGVLAGAGRAYVAEGVRVDGRFHPKVFLLTGEERALLFVGSGNLSVGGLYRNAEVFERWEATHKAATMPPAFDAVRQYIDRVLSVGLSPVPTHVVDVLDAAFGASPLQKPAAADESTAILGSPGALLAQLPPPPGAAEHLRMLAPFFDDGGEAAVALAKQFRAKQFDVVVDPAMSNLTAAARNRIERAGGRFLRASASGRAVHAKAIHARGETWQASVHGSANLSIAAWRGANAELVVSKTAEGAAKVAELIDEVTGEELTDADWKLLEQREEARATSPDDEEAQPLGPLPVSACWLDAERVLFTLRAASSGIVAAELMVRDRTWRTTRLTSTGTELRAHFDTQPGAGSTVGRLVSAEGDGPWIVVHDRVELRDRGRALERADVQLRNHLSWDSGTARDATDFLEFLGRLFEERKRLDSEQPKSPAAASEPSSAPKPEWRFVKEEDFRAPESSSEGAGVNSSEGHTALDPTRLMLRLLFGDLDLEDADASEGESGLTEAAVDGPAPQAPKSGRAKRDAEVVLRSAAMRARTAYLDTLRRAGGQGRSPGRMLEDLEVLSVALYRGLRSGGLSAPAFLAEYAPVLRAFFGAANTPFCLALSAVPEEERPAFWARTPVLAASCLLVFNACLADLEVGQYEEEPSPDFVHVAPVLWLRHVLRHAPTDQPLATLEKQLPRIRKQGQLWLASHWPHLEASCDFALFAARQIEMARALDRLQAALRPKRVSEAGRLDGDTDCVLGFGRDGSLAAGFVDPPEKLVSIAWLHDGAFQNPEPSENGRHDRLHKTTSRQVLPFRVAYEVVKRDAQLLAAVELLKRIASG